MAMGVVAQRTIRKKQAREKANERFMKDVKFVNVMLTCEKFATLQFLALGWR
jgi:hypothetical protein